MRLCRGIKIYWSIVDLQGGLSFGPINLIVWGCYCRVGIVEECFDIEGGCHFLRVGLMRDWILDLLQDQFGFVERVSWVVNMVSLVVDRVDWVERGECYWVLVRLGRLQQQIAYDCQCVGCYFSYSFYSTVFQQPPNRYKIKLSEIQIQSQETITIVQNKQNYQLASNSCIFTSPTSPHLIKKQIIRFSQTIFNILFQKRQQQYHKQQAMNNYQRQSYKNQKPKQQYINTYYLPPDKRITAVPYYQRKKQQLQAMNKNQSFIQNQGLNHHYTGEQIKQSISLSLKNKKDIDQSLLNYIKEVRVDSIYAENQFTNFREEDYPLDNTEQVAVVQEILFPKQNYYNYICAQEHNKQIGRFVERTQQKIKDNALSPEKIKQKQFQKQNNKSNQLEILQSLFKGEQQNQTNVIKVNGHYDTRYHPRLNQVIEGEHVPNIDLIPKHKYFAADDIKSKTYNFNVKEEERVRIIEGFKNK